MSSKTISYTTKFTPRQAINLRDILIDLYGNETFLKYLTLMQGTELSIVIEPTVLKAEKEQMYAYYHKVVCSVAMTLFTDMGWESVDKYKADEILKTQCAKDFLINLKTGEQVPFLEPKSRMTKDRFRKYLTDCIHFIESHGYEVPDSVEYKVEQLTGLTGFKKV